MNKAFVCIPMDDKAKFTFNYHYHEVSKSLFRKYIGQRDDWGLIIYEEDPNRTKAEELAYVVSLVAQANYVIFGNGWDKDNLCIFVKRFCDICMIDTIFQSSSIITYDHLPMQVIVPPYDKDTTVNDIINIFCTIPETYDVIHSTDLYNFAIGIMHDDQTVEIGNTDELISEAAFIDDKHKDSNSSIAFDEDDSDIKYVSYEKAFNDGAGEAAEINVENKKFFAMFFADHYLNEESTKNDTCMKKYKYFYYLIGDNFGNCTKIVSNPKMMNKYNRFLGTIACKNDNWYRLANDFGYNFKPFRGAYIDNETISFNILDRDSNE